MTRKDEDEEQQRLLDQVANPRTHAATLKIESKDVIKERKERAGRAHELELRRQRRDDWTHCGLLVILALALIGCGLIIFLPGFSQGLREKALTGFLAILAGVLSFFIGRKTI